MDIQDRLIVGRKEIIMKLNDKELKIMVIKMLTELGRMDKQRQYFTRDRKYIQAKRLFLNPSTLSFANTETSDPIAIPNIQYQNIWRS